MAVDTAKSTQHRENTSIPFQEPASFVSFLVNIINRITFDPTIARVNSRGFVPPLTHASSTGEGGEDEGG